MARPSYFDFCWRLRAGARVLLVSILISVTILSMCLQEAAGSRAHGHGHSSRRHLSTEHHHHAARGGSGSRNADGDGVEASSARSRPSIDDDTELRRIPGKYICMEDEDERDRLTTKNKMHCKCPKMYAPVCGSDNVTYHNRCFMQCASKYKYEGFSRVKLQVEKWGPCDPDHEMPVQG